MESFIRSFSSLYFLTIINLVLPQYGHFTAFGLPFLTENLNLHDTHMNFIGSFSSAFSEATRFLTNSCIFSMHSTQTSFLFSSYFILLKLNSLLHLEHV